MRAVRRISDDSDGKPTQKLELLADALVAQGIDGNVPALKEIADRLDGRAIQAIEHSGTITTLSSLVEASMVQSDTVPASKTSVH